MAHVGTGHVSSLRRSIYSNPAILFRYPSCGLAAFAGPLSCGTAKCVQAGSPPRNTGHGSTWPSISSPQDVIDVFGPEMIGGLSERCLRADVG